MTTPVEEPAHAAGFQRGLAPVGRLAAVPGRSSRLHTSFGHHEGSCRHADTPKSQRIPAIRGCINGGQRRYAVLFDQANGSVGCHRAELLNELLTVVRAISSSSAVSASSPRPIVKIGIRFSAALWAWERA